MYPFNNRARVWLKFLLVWAGCLLCVVARDLTPLDAGWRFALNSSLGVLAPAQQAQVGFDDSSWAAATLPHTWNEQDGTDGGDNYYRGIGWYRRPLAIPTEWTGKRVVLRFRGASRVARVYVNGIEVASHAGAHTAFAVDVTERVTPGETALLAVQVDNTPSPDLAPQTGYVQFGGLHRSVELIVLDPVHVSPLVMAGPGVDLKPTVLSDLSGNLAARVYLRSMLATDSEAVVTLTVRDAAGAVVSSSEQTVVAVAAATGPVDLSLEIPAVHRWRGRIDPYLYTAEVAVSRGGIEVDRVSERVGFRSVRFSAGSFYLNDEVVQLRGVCLHEDWAGSGSALSVAQREADLQMIMQMGANAVRLVHYPHDRWTLQRCDELGLMVWSEAPALFSIGASAAFRDSLRNNLREMIAQLGNSPSVVVWGVMNEPAGDTVSNLALLGQELAGIARLADPSRPVVGAHNNSLDSVLVQSVGDSIAGNIYTGFFGGYATSAGSEMDGWRSRSSGRPFGLGEYGAGGRAGQQEYWPAVPAPFGAWLPEDYQTIFYEFYADAIRQRPWLWCHFAYLFADQSADEYVQAGTSGVAYIGLVTRDRSIRKDAWHWLRANWSDEPVVHLAGRRPADAPYPIIPIKAFSNGIAVEVFLNGVSLGRQLANELPYTWPIAATNSTRRRFIWPQVPLHAGENVILAVADFADGSTRTDTMTFNWSPPDLGYPGVPLVRVNFQAAGSVPSGFVADTGAPFGSRGNGFSYGWSATNTVMATRSTSNPIGKEYQSLAHFQRPGQPLDLSWKIAVPNGLYWLHVVGGDPDYVDTTYDLRVNGAAFVQGAPTERRRWVQKRALLRVANGEIVVGSGPTAYNNKISFLTVERWVAPWQTGLWEAEDLASLPDQVAAFGDWDQDGTPNLVEQALGGDALVPGVLPPTRVDALAAPDGAPGLEVSRVLRTGEGYTVAFEWTGDLTSPTWSPAGDAWEQLPAESVAGDPSASLVRWRWRTTSPRPSRVFVRFVVSETPPL